MVQIYNIHGAIVQIQSSHKKLLKTIRSHWKSFHSNPCHLKPKVVFYITKYNPGRTAWEWNYFYNDNFLMLLNRQRCIVWNLYMRPWLVYIQYLQYVDERDITFLYYYLFEPIFLGILKRLGLFYMHSSAVTKNGRGILFPGGPKSSKTTTALSLLRAGFKILSDDDIFLKKTGSSVYALGFNEEMYITDKTMSFFPELEFLKNTPLHKKGPQFKRRIDVKKVYPDSTARKSRVQLLLFPKITTRKKTKIEPLSKSQALMKCFRQKPKEYRKLIMDGIGVKQYFELFTTLTESARSYNLFIGKELSCIPKLINDILYSAKRGEIAMPEKNKKKKYIKPTLKHHGDIGLITQ